MVKSFVIDCTMEDYLKNPLSREQIIGMRELMDSVAPKVSQFEKLIFQIFKGFSISFLILISLATFFDTFNIPPLNQDNGVIKGIAQGYLLGSGILLFVSSLGLDLFIPGKRILSIKINGRDVIRGFDFETGMGMNDKLQDCSISGKCLKLPEIQDFTISLQGRSPLVFESIILERYLYTKYCQNNKENYRLTVIT